MATLRELLLERLGDGRSVLVFPSQAAADAWAVEILRGGGVPALHGAGGRPDGAASSGGAGRSGSSFAAVDPDRFIGWDRFKERHLSARRDERPANRVTRTLWAALVVARQEERPFLRAILGEGRPSPAFVPFLAKLPPSLESLARAVGSARAAGRIGDDPLLSDLVRLRDECRSFMRERDLFEPAWEGISITALDRPHILIAPELVEDWDEWAEDLASLPGFETLGLPKAEEENGLLRFENAWAEYQAVFHRIAALIDQGIAPDDIGVTVADLDAARPWIEAAAEAAGLPLVIRRGLPLAGSPFGRLITALGAAVESGFGLPAMKALLLDRFATWKDAKSSEGLVRFGIEFHAFASWSREGRTIDVWEESFRATGRTGLASWYRLLRSATRKIVDAPTFDALRDAVTSFRNQFLDEGSWSPEELRLVERCMEELSALERAEADFARGERLPSPFAIWLSTLRDEAYVPQRRGSFVQAYPWRVSALLPFRYHFLLGCGFDEVVVRYGAASFLREDLKESLGKAGTDATEAFLRAYLLSGDVVQPCHAEEEIGGWSAPHPFFAGKETPTLPEPTPDARRLELEAWKGAGRLPSRLLPAQKVAFAAFRVASGKGSPEGRRGVPPFGALPAGLLSKILPRRTNGELLRLSHSHLAAYRACPFRWLLSRALRVEEEPLDLGFFDNLLAGDMAHRAIERLFEGMGELGSVRREKLDDYRRLAAAAPEAILGEFVRDKGPFLEPMFEAWAPLLSDRLVRLVEALVEDPGWEIGDLELPLEHELPDIGVLLEGRIDRLARRGGEFAIVDYKKKRLPKKNELKLSGEDGGEGEPEEGAAGEERDPETMAAAAGELANTQMAAYIELVEARLGAVSRASFWSIEDARELVVIGEGGLKAPGAYGPELASLRELLGRAASGMRAGAFGWAPPGSPACVDCAAKAICRSHYSAGS